MGDKVPDLIHCELVEGGVSNDATVPNILWLKLKLGFHEDEQVAVIFKTATGSRQNFSKRNKRDITHNELHHFSQILRCKESGIKLLAYDYTGVVAEFPHKLIGAYIHRMHT